MKTKFAVQLTLLLSCLLVNGPETFGQAVPLAFDCKGQLLHAPPQHLAPGTSIEVTIDANCPEFKNQIYQFIQSLEKAKANLSGTKYYEWEALFKAYGFNQADRETEIVKLQNWINYLHNYLHNRADRPSTPAYSFVNATSFDGLFYLHVAQGITNQVVELTYDSARRQFMTTIMVEASEIQIQLHRWDIEKYYMQAAYREAPMFDTIPIGQIDRLYTALEQVESTPDTFNPTRALQLQTVWNTLKSLIDSSILEGNKGILQNLLWLSEGKPTINITKAATDTEEDYNHFAEDSISYYGALTSLNAKFRDGCMCDISKTLLPPISCTCVAREIAEIQNKLDANKESLKNRKPGTDEYKELVRQNKILEKEISIFEELKGKCSLCTDPAAPHAYRPTFDKMASDSFHLARLKRAKADYDEHEEEEKKDKKAKATKAPKEYWLADIKLFTDTENKITWMRHHDYSRNMGLMSPIDELKGEYLENQAIAVLTHNVPMGIRISMHETIDTVEEQSHFEEALYSPLAVVLDIVNTTAIKRKFMGTPNVTAANYEKIREDLEYSLKCLSKEFDFDKSLVYTFPADDSASLHTEISHPETNWGAPIKVTYSLSAHRASESFNTSSKSVYRRNRLWRITPSVLIGATSIPRYEYEISGGQVLVRERSKISYAIGLNTHLARINLRNPYVIFSKKGKKHDLQPHFSLSRISLFTGVSILEPLREFYLGPSVELFPGLGITGGLNVFVQDVINGASNPIDYRTRYGFFASVSISPSVFLQLAPNKGKNLPLFSRLRKGSSNITPSSTNQD
jgi:hypothetical protein